jgi:hypothetical protein
LEDLDAEVDVNSDWDMIREYPNFSQRELKKHKP